MGLAMLAGAAGNAQATDLRDIRIWDGPENTRVVFDLSGESRHRVFTLENPDRIVIDLSGVDNSRLKAPEIDGGSLLQQVRSARQPDGTLRVVLDVTQRARARSFALTPQANYGHRVVVDLSPERTESGVTAEARDSRDAGATQASRGAATVVEPVSRLEQKAIIIAVDAGHGGEDPGARGPSGLMEKDVALAISRRLAKKINAEPGFRAVLIRDGDYYIGLRERVKKAREAQADLFVSLHANGFTDARVTGSSVYTLSPSGASSEQARWLAQRENDADLVGGVALSDKEDTLAHVLLDISQSAAIEASVDAGKRVLDSLGRLNKLQRGEVQRAGFMVLKAPDIPSMLVETAFITNPGEERKLGSADFQERIAESIFKGVHSYFAHYRPLRYVDSGAGANEFLASDRRHTVSRGDTLSEIAERYRVASQQLRRANDLNGDLLRVGQVLQIP